MHPKIEKMLKRMKEKQKRSKKKSREAWFLYILECCDGSFYTGVTNNMERRLKTHNAGRASRFTRARVPVKLMYQEPCKGRTNALIRECAVKALSRKKKEILIASRLEV